MRHRRWLTGIVFGLMAWVNAAGAAEVTTAFLHCTYLIRSDAVFGTAFILGQPVDGNMARAHLVLVTAAHLLESIHTDTAILDTRVRDGQGWRKESWPITIRHQGRAMWVRHPVVDLAAMRVDLPKGADERVPTVNLAATDMDYHRFDVQPGDAVMVLGFPMAMDSGPAGFPILRGGRLASYPLTPIRTEKTFLVDAPIFPGNSGGPVIMAVSGRVLKNGARAGLIQVLLGVVSREVLAADTETDDPAATSGRPLTLARVVHAAFIQDLMEKLPPP